VTQWRDPLLTCALHACSVRACVTGPVFPVRLYGLTCTAVVVPVLSPDRVTLVDTTFTVTSQSTSTRGWTWSLSRSARRAAGPGWALTQRARARSTGIQGLFTSRYNRNEVCLLRRWRRMTREVGLGEAGAKRGRMANGSGTVLCSGAPWEAQHQQTHVLGLAATPQPSGAF
jgi:hypothetical protein